MTVQDHKVTTIATQRLLGSLITGDFALREIEVIGASQGRSDSSRQHCTDENHSA